MSSAYTLPFAKLGRHDVETVGGKNSSLGEMISHLAQAGVTVPDGFATTAQAYRDFLQHEGLAARISKELATLDVDDVEQLANIGARIRQWILSTPFPPRLQSEILESFERMSGGREIAVAVRSSATAEDLPDASFAGQQETFLNVRGRDALLKCVHEVFASLFNDRAIAYRVHQGFAHDQVALSAGIQYMVRSDLGASGVMFTLDTDSGFRNVVFITSSYGLGETVVQGAVNPDEFYVYKAALRSGHAPILRRTLGAKAIKMVYSAPGAASRVTTVDVPPEDRRRFSVTDQDLIELAKQALIIEEHYGCPMDIEWGKDGETGKIYILQARPETVQSRAGRTVQRFSLKGKKSKVLASGRSIGQRIGAGPARIIRDVKEMTRVQSGDVLVADMTDPDWEPVMKRAAAIVTNRGGRTCHAAIIARELGIPAVVGCGDATETIREGMPITVSCAEGDTGFVYEGAQAFEVTRTELATLARPSTGIMMNVGNPDEAFALSFIPNDGVGLARIEFIISAAIGIHPMALVNYEALDERTRQLVDSRTEGYADKPAFFVDKLAEGVATIAAAFYPKDVIVRLSDFKTNEYSRLIGGQAFEPAEENPMLGFRGAARYYHPRYREGFALECRALRKVRSEMGLTNVTLMVPFCRTLEEARLVVEELAHNGLVRGEDGLELYMMVEIPSNVILLTAFACYFDGFSIGSNDLTQLTLGVDRDSEIVADEFDERDLAVETLIAQAIERARRCRAKIGLCGQAPSDYPDFARFLVMHGINSMSLNPDAVLSTTRIVLAAEAANRPAPLLEPRPC